MANKILFNLLVLFKGIISFLIFLCTSQIFTLLIIVPFSIKHNKPSTTYSRLLKAYACFITKTHFNIKFTHLDFTKDKFSTPALIVCNHQSLIDAPLVISFSSKMRVINNNWHANAGARFFLLKYIRFFPIDLGKDKLVEALKPSIDIGCPVLIFPEGVYSTNKIGRFHKGGFYIAEKLKIDVQPVVIHYSENVFKRKWFYLKNGEATIKYLNRVKFGSKEYGENYQELTRNVANKMSNEYHKLASSL
ncbi:MAG: lysophospholipid acyltransferase family protein [Bacteroidota bacterium]